MPAEFKLDELKLDLSVFSDSELEKISAIALTDVIARQALETSRGKTVDGANQREYQDSYKKILLDEGETTTPDLLRSGTMMHNRQGDRRGPPVRIIKAGAESAYTGASRAKGMTNEQLARHLRDKLGFDVPDRFGAADEKLIEKHFDKWFERAVKKL